jgi:hypothetical protein
MSAQRTVAIYHRSYRHERFRDVAKLPWATPAALARRNCQPPAVLILSRVSMEHGRSGRAK